MSRVQDMQNSYMELQAILESNARAPITQAITQSIGNIIKDWDTAYTDTLLIQCGKDIFFNTITHWIPHVCLVEPCSQTFIELQRQYLHLSLFGNNLYYINADAKTFDYTILLYPTLYRTDMKEILREVLRVTARSVLLIFFNACSLEYCLSKINKKKKYQYYVWYSASQLVNMIYSIQKHVSISISSIGMWPLSDKASRYKRYIPMPYSCGTIGTMHINVSKTKVMTPIITPVHHYGKSSLQWSEMPQ